MSTPTPAQISSYSSLAGALTPTFRPYYVLPQDTTLPDAQSSQVTENAPPSTIKSILFTLHNGSLPWVPLTSALGNILDLEYNMLGGRDLVFPRTVKEVKLDLRVAWPGYTGATISLTFKPADTTRALLAKAIARQVEIYMNCVSRVPSTSNGYRIGPYGIQSDRVLLEGLEHIGGHRWRVVIVIDNSMNV